MKTAKLYFNKNNNKFSIIKLKDLCTFTTGKLDVNAENPKGKYKFFTCAREDKYIDYYAFNGLAILIAGNGDVGHTKLYNGKFNAYQRTYVLQNFKGDAQYIKQQIDFKLPKKVQEELQGGAMPYIKLETLSNLNIHLPNLEEQQKISTFLSAFDLKIEHESQIIEQLKQLKKSLLYKMFPTENSNVPELRFKGFTETWEQRKLGDYSEIITGGTPNTLYFEYWNPKEIPWMSSGEINNKVIWATDNMISKIGLSKSSAKWVKEQSVLIALAGQGKTRGTVAITEIPLTTSQSIAAIQPSDSLYYKFLFQNLEGRYEDLRSISSGDGTRGGLNKQILLNLIPLAPTINEQRKIGDFLCTLDNLITLHQCKYDKLVQVKKALLSKMFV